MCTTVIFHDVVTSQILLEIFYTSFHISHNSEGNMLKNERERNQPTTKTIYQRWSQVEKCLSEAFNLRTSFVKISKLVKTSYFLMPLHFA